MPSSSSMDQSYSSENKDKRLHEAKSKETKYHSPELEKRISVVQKKNMSLQDELKQAKANEALHEVLLRESKDRSTELEKK